MAPGAGGGGTAAPLLAVSLAAEDASMLSGIAAVAPQRLDVFGPLGRNEGFHRPQQLFLGH
ncbi:MAG: hypothetical protein AcusKO_16870 [Acuticoccus sp.]